MSASEQDIASESLVSSEEWFVRYLLDAGFLLVLVLTAIGVSMYLDAGDYFRDWSREPDAGFLLCMVLVPVLAMVALGLAIYAGVRLFMRPRSFSHSLVRLTLLLAHVFVLLVCVDTITTTSGAVAAGFRQLMSGGAGRPGNVVQGRFFPGSQYDAPEGESDDLQSIPPELGPGGPAMPGREAGPR
ncbi:MAG: hypothetical protein KBI32_07350 [Phycisphaerae bacterium]|nr:hypothetical protein [Phycisphaerae bacterium]HON90545.1 hypothetical protein [Sedimentisphaerales bacterium]